MFLGPWAQGSSFSLNPSHSSFQILSFLHTYASFKYKIFTVFKVLPFLCHHNYNAFRWKLPKIDLCNCVPHAWALGPEFCWSDFDKPISGWFFAICCPQSPTGILCLLLISSLICFFSFSLLCFYHCMTFSLPINIAIMMDLWPYPNLSWPSLNLIMLYNLIKSTDLTPRFWLNLIKLRSHSTSKTLFPYMNTSTHIQEFRNWMCPFRKQRFNQDVRIGSKIYQSYLGSTHSCSSWFKSTWRPCISESSLDLRTFLSLYLWHFHQPNFPIDGQALEWVFFSFSTNVDYAHSLWTLHEVSVQSPFIFIFS